MRATTHPTAGDFLGVAETFLRDREERSLLVRSVAQRVRDGRKYGDAPPWFVTVTDAGEVQAAAVRTPPHAALVHCSVPGALAALIDRLHEVDPDLSGVGGPADETALFVRGWEARTGRRAEVRMRQQLLRLETGPEPAVASGHLRRAEDGDTPTLARWIAAFAAEATPDDPPFDAVAAVERMRRAGFLAVWDDREPVSIAAGSRVTTDVAMISAVYTPPERRGNGYASACVSALSRELRRDGRTACMLFTDRANPTSNRIYRRIGFRPVVDYTRYGFPGARPRGERPG